MNFFKKVLAVGLAAVMAAGMTACDNSDKTWSVKYGDTTMPIGVYIYYEYAAYQNASSMVTDTATPVLEQKIEDKDAVQWIKDTAMHSLKLLLAVDDQLKDKNLTLSEEEQKTAETAATSLWASYEKEMTGYGVSKESFKKAYGEFSVKSNKLFQAIYGKDGSTPVSDEDLKKFFEENYADFSFLVLPLYDPTTGQALDDATLADRKAAMDTYAQQLAKGEKTLDEINSDFKTKMELESSEIQTVTSIMDETNGYPEAMTNLIKELKPGEAKTLDLSDMSSYVLILKNDVTQNTEKKFSTDDGRNSVLGKLKGQEFSDMLDKAADELTGITVNQSVIDSYKPEMFVKADTSSTP